MKKISDVFVKFNNECKVVFKFLEKKYGFQKDEPKQAKYEIYIRYKRNDQMRIEINFEYGSFPWILIKSKSGKKWNETPFHKIMEDKFDALNKSLNELNPANEKTAIEALKIYKQALEIYLESENILN